MSLELIYVQALMADMAILNERILMEEQRFKINAAKTLKRANAIYHFISRFDAFPQQLIDELGKSISLKDYDKIQEVSKQVIVMVGHLRKGNSNNQ